MQPLTQRGPFKEAGSTQNLWHTIHRAIWPNPRLPQTQPTSHTAPSPTSAAGAHLTPHHCICRSAGWDVLLTVKLPALDRARYRHLADPDPNRNDRPWPITLTYNNRHPPRAMDVTHAHVKYQDQRSASSKAGVETNGRTQSIALPFTLTRSANASPIFQCSSGKFLNELTEKAHTFVTAILVFQLARSVRRFPLFVCLYLQKLLLS